MNGFSENFVVRKRSRRRWFVCGRVLCSKSINLFDVTACDPVLSDSCEFVWYFYLPFGNREDSLKADLKHSNTINLILLIWWTARRFPADNAPLVCMKTSISRVLLQITFGSIVVRSNWLARSDGFVDRLHRIVTMPSSYTGDLYTVRKTVSILEIASRTSGSN